MALVIKDVNDLNVQPSGKKVQSKSKMDPQLPILTNKMKGRPVKPQTINPAST